MEQQRRTVRIGVLLDTSNEDDVIAAIDYRRFAALEASEGGLEYGHLCDSGFELVNEGRELVLSGSCEVHGNCVLVRRKNMHREEVGSTEGA